MQIHSRTPSLYLASLAERARTCYKLVPALILSGTDDAARARRLTHCPVGGDTEQVGRDILRSGITPKLNTLRALYEGKIIVGRDKLDVVKKVLQKLALMRGKRLLEMMRESGKAAMCAAESGAGRVRVGARVGRCHHGRRSISLVVVLAAVQTPLTAIRLWIASLFWLLLVVLLSLATASPTRTLLPRSSFTVNNDTGTVQVFNGSGNLGTQGAATDGTNFDFPALIWIGFSLIIGLYPHLLHVGASTQYAKTLFNGYAQCLLEERMACRDLSLYCMRRP
ncbi:Glycosyltransferase family 20 protein [Mycena sanguinolenta]|uniref:Glycosyltransferase family 20 protein n=1 Tax=Mycena sanguinolenta TaxID=230812 RepID=A0A8H6WSM2_9AGAR|nr:Glycosyltransferase family 20 protein [Mycena sanguinolenta]